MSSVVVEERWDENLKHTETGFFCELERYLYIRLSLEEWYCSFILPPSQGSPCTIPLAFIPLGQVKQCLSIHGAVSRKLSYVLY